MMQLRTRRVTIVYRDLDRVRAGCGPDEVGFEMVPAPGPRIRTNRSRLNEF